MNEKCHRIPPLFDKNLPKKILNISEMTNLDDCQQN